MEQRTLDSRAWRFVAILLALGVSAAALFTLVQVERGVVHAAIAPETMAESADDTGERFLPPNALKPSPGPAHPQAVLAALAPSTTDAQEPTAMEAGQVRVPDFTGKRLGQARREAKELGLKLVARDGYGERVPAELGPYYRVRKQASEPGSDVASGSTVEVRVRAIESYASGY